MGQCELAPLFVLAVLVLLIQFPFSSAGRLPPRCAWSFATELEGMLHGLQDHHAL